MLLAFTLDLSRNALGARGHEMRYLGLPFELPDDVLL
jgi:hypothetical protein